MFDVVILLARYAILGARYNLQAKLADMRLARLAWSHCIAQGSDVQWLASLSSLSIMAVCCSSAFLQKVYSADWAPSAISYAVLLRD